jgi:hypothetical protein
MTGYDVKRLALVLAAQAELEAMKAENIQRERAGQAIAYGEKPFRDLSQRLENLAFMHDHQL